MKKNNNPDYSKMLEKIAGVENLIKMNLIKPVFQFNELHFYHEALWSGKDEEFKKNWCKNLYIYCGLVGKKDFNKKKPVKFIDIDSHELVATFFNDITTIIKY